jgi:hypothetical protein
VTPARVTVDAASAATIMSRRGTLSASAPRIGEATAAGNVRLASATPTAVAPPASYANTAIATPYDQPATSVMARAVNSVRKSGARSTAPRAAAEPFRRCFTLSIRPRP